MQKIVAKFNQTYRHPLNPNIRIMDIQSEVGELTKEVIKVQKYGTLPFAVTHDMQLELGDVLYSVLSFAEEQGIDAEQALHLAIAKYEARIAQKGHIGSGN